MNHNVAFIHIITSTEPSVIPATAKYLFTCFNKRMQINIWCLLFKLQILNCIYLSNWDVVNIDLFDRLLKQKVPSLVTRLIMHICRWMVACTSDGEILPQNISQLPTALSKALYYHLYFSASILTTSLRDFWKTKKDAGWVKGSLNALYMLMMLSCLYLVLEAFCIC